MNPATVTDLSARSAFLGAFNGLDPNGTWTLFVADVSGGDVSTLVSWELEITAVPEPTTWALGILGGMWLTVSGRRLWTRRGRWLSPEPSQPVTAERYNFSGSCISARMRCNSRPAAPPSSTR